jgi:hypothetical protein
VIAARPVSSTRVFFQTTSVEPGVLAEYDRIRNGLPPGSARLLVDQSMVPEAPRERSDEIVRFDGRDFADWGFATSSPTLVPGHNHFALLRAFASDPTHDWYWYVEYDVRFTGDWRRFFEACSGLDADLLTCHVRRYVDEPKWTHWPLSHPVHSVPLASRLRSFNVVVRFSRRALSALHDLHKAGWAGHHEVLVPTLLRAEGLEIADLGGDGPFVPAGFRNRFYTSFSTLDGGLEWLGTVRYRPSRARPGRRRGALYHPVKPAGRFRPRTRQEQVRESLWELARHVKWRLRRSGLPGSPP